MAKTTTPQARFEDLVDECLAVDGVSPPGPGRSFGSSALKRNNKIFAMLVRDRLVLKLPRKRVDELVEAGEGERFDANKGTPMKEWLTLGASSKLSWSALAHEAMAFASGKPAASKPAGAGKPAASKPAGAGKRASGKPKSRRSG